MAEARHLELVENLQRQPRVEPWQPHPVPVAGDGSEGVTESNENLRLDQTLAVAQSMTDLPTLSHCQQLHHRP